MAVVQGKIYRIKSHAGGGLCLRLASGTQTVAAHKLLQTATESTTNMGQRWVVKNISGRKIVSAIDNSYAINFDTADTTRKAEIYQYSNSDANTSLVFENVDTSNNIYKITITISGTVYYLTAGSKTSTAYATWEPSSGGDNQKWKFIEVSEKFTWPTVSETITQYFNSGVHEGIDIAPLVANEPGNAVYAIADGVVERRFDCEEGDSTDDNGSMGICLFIKHDKSVSSSGKYLRSLYMHLDDINNLYEGDTVSKGQLIGHMGHTGRCISANGGNGTHLHLGLKENDTAFTNNSYYTGTFVDPLSYEFE